MNWCDCDECENPLVVTKIRDGKVHWLNESGLACTTRVSGVLHYADRTKRWAMLHDAMQEFLGRFSAGDTVTYEGDLWLVNTAPTSDTAMMLVHLKNGDLMPAVDWENCKKTDTKLIADWGKFAKRLRGVLNKGKDDTAWLLALVGPDYNIFAQEALRLLEKEMTSRVHKQGAINQAEIGIRKPTLPAVFGEPYGKLDSKIDGLHDFQRLVVDKCTITEMGEPGIIDECHRIANTVVAGNARRPYLLQQASIFEKLEVYTVDHHEFEEFIKEETGKTLNFVDYFEMSNDTENLFLLDDDVDENVEAFLKSDCEDIYDYEDAFLTWEDVFGYLYTKKRIPTKNLLVKVSW